MITVRTRFAPSRAGRRAASLAVTGALALAACGGDDDSAEPADDGATSAVPADDSVPETTVADTSGDGASETTVADTSGDGASGTAVAGDGSGATTLPANDDATADYEPGAEIFRVVNSTTDPVDVYVRTTGLVKAYEIQPGLAPGEITEFFAPPQDGSVIVTAAGAGDPTCVSSCDHFIADTFVWDDTGDTFTILLHDADGEPEAYVLWEETGANTTSANAMVAADPASGQFVAIAVDVAEADFGMRLGVSGVDGCLEPVNLSGGILVGGNQTPAYAYDGGSAEVFLYDNRDQECSGDPVGGPFAVTGGPGTRTFLFLTGTPGDLDAIIVPFGSDDGATRRARVR